MLNANAGKKIQIPLNTAPAVPAATSPADKMLSQAMESARSASFAPPAAPAPAPVRPAGVSRRKPADPAKKTIMKGVYFEPAVYNALLVMQEKGQNVSKFINQLVRQSLAI
jgi:hypothetical protein